MKIMLCYSVKSGRIVVAAITVARFSDDHEIKKNARRMF